MYYKLSIWLITIVGLLSSCTKETTSDILPSNKEHDILINIVFEKERIVDTKADTPRLTDFNIYFFNEKLDFSKHVYDIKKKDILINLAEGDYKVYVIGNWGSDLGAKSQYELQSMLEGINVITEKDIYTYYESLNITADQNLKIALLSVFTKINLNLEIDPSFQDKFTLTSVQLRNVPTSCMLFLDNKPKEGMIDYPADIFDTQKYSFTKEYKMLENMQGLTMYGDSETVKNLGSVNKNVCTYFHIKGITNNNTYVEYFVLLGEDNNKSLNSKRNTIYNHTIKIMGMNVVDHRVAILNASIDKLEKTYFTLGSQASTLIYTQSHTNNNRDRKLYIEYNLISGTGKANVSGKDFEPNKPWPIQESDSDQKLALFYKQDTAGDVEIEYKIFEDNDGDTNTAEDQLIVYKTTHKMIYYEP